MDTFAKEAILSKLFFLPTISIGIYPKIKYLFQGVLWLGKYFFLMETIYLYQRPGVQESN